MDALARLRNAKSHAVVSHWAAYTAVRQRKSQAVCVAREWYLCHAARSAFCTWQTTCQVRHQRHRQAITGAITCMSFGCCPGSPQLYDALRQPQLVNQSARSTHFTCCHACALLQDRLALQGKLAEAVAVIRGGTALRVWRAWLQFSELRRCQRTLLTSAIAALINRCMFRSFAAWQVNVNLASACRGGAAVNTVTASGRLQN